MRVQYAAGFKNASFLKEQRLLVPFDLKKLANLWNLNLVWKEIFKRDWVLLFFFQTIIMLCHGCHDDV